MMGSAAHEANVEVTVLASSPDDCALATSDHSVIGAPTDARALHRLSRLVDVITFDHELVDLEQIGQLESLGVTVRPSARALSYSVDKAHQRREFRRAGIAVPDFVITRSGSDRELDEFLDRTENVVVKSARGGYDGRGVIFPATRADAIEAVESFARGEVVVEERLELLCELSQIVVRAVDAQCVTYPLVRTVQSEGMCVEVTFPALVDSRVERQAQSLARSIAELTGAVGVVAVELFLTTQGLVVNEIALRPHNSGHWTIEGAVTSQFAIHLLAVSVARLSSADACVEAAAMVNVVGADREGSLVAAMDVAGAHVHDYGKSWRRGRKLGHVTAVGDDLASAHVRAWESARAYGTKTREA